MRRVVWLWSAALVLVAAHARADADELCLADSIEGQVLRSHGRLLRAREHLAGCAQASCEAAMRAKCATWLRESTEDTPRIRLRIEDDRGVALTHAIVHLDGTVADVSQVVEADPGKHVATADFAGRRGLSEFVARRGEQEVRVLIDLREKVESRPTPVATYVLGGVTGLTAIALGAFGVWAVVQSHQLAGCSPYCSPSLRGSLDTAMTGADVSLGLSAAALLATVIVQLARPTVTREIRLGTATAPRRWSLGGVSF